MLSEGEQDIQLHTEVSVLGSSSFIFNLGIIYWAVAMCPGNREAGHTLFHLLIILVTDLVLLQMCSLSELFLSLNCGKNTSHANCPLKFVSEQYNIAADL